MNHQTIPSSPIRFDLFGEAVQLFTRNGVAWVLHTAAYLVFVGIVQTVLPDGFLKHLISSAVGIVASIGFAELAVKTIRGRPVTLAGIRVVGPRMQQALLTIAMSVFAVAIGLALCIVPGAIALGLLQFALFFVLDRDMGASHAIQSSIAALRTQAVPAVLFLLLAALVGAAGVLLLGVGLLATIPVATIALALQYRNLCG